MAEKVVVTGMGVVSALGLNLEENKRALLTGKSGIGPIRHLQTRHSELPVGEINRSTEGLLKTTNPKEPRAWSRTSLLALIALREAAGSSNYAPDSNVRTGLISATTVGGMDRTEHFYPEFLKDESAGHMREVVHHDCGASTELLADELSVNGFLTTINTACSSSVNSIMLGVRLIQSGRLDRVFVGGTDALSRFTLNGFNSLMILSPEPCRPFDADRRGLNLGEGAAYLMLESEKSARESGRQVLAAIGGFANTNDAHHQTASSPEGIGARMAMEQSLKMAGLSPGDIQALNAHGTATSNNDLTEGIAISNVFRSSVPMISSTKSFTGHTLGASGSIEAVYSILSLSEQKVFPNLRLETPIPEHGFEAVRELTDCQIEHIMSNSFGFGGNCSSIIFSAI